jgi:hypothetical protein
LRGNRLLARLRTSEEDKSYKVPCGFLFSLVRLYPFPCPFWRYMCIVPLLSHRRPHLISLPGLRYAVRTMRANWWRGQAFVWFTIILQPFSSWALWSATSSAEAGMCLRLGEIGNMWITFAGDMQQRTAPRPGPQSSNVAAGGWSVLDSCEPRSAPSDLTRFPA